jgi:Phytanoyl-CoA dioxygenase (PhyH)
MPGALDAALEGLERDGFVVVPDVFAAGDVADMVREIVQVLESAAGKDAAILGPPGGVYGARNLLRSWPRVATAWRRPPMPELLHRLLGPVYGLVRVLYFDKPPERSWSLPWHKDLTIAVRDNRRPSRLFEHPTPKAGVPHVEAPTELLEGMVTLRLHLDAVTEENGPLLVLPGSHGTGRELVCTGFVPHKVLCGRGSVLVMRPLLAHSSVNAHPETRRHRRILHLEFAASPTLPDGYAWHDFVPGA